MIRPQNSVEFLFVNSSNIKSFAPEKSRIYVQHEDNGQGKIKVHGRIDREISPLVPATDGQPERPARYEEIGWVRTGVEIRPDSPTLFADAHQAVIAKLAELNPSVQFEIY